MLLWGVVAKLEKAVRDMISDPEMYSEGKPLIMDNKKVFNTSERQMDIPKILQRVV